MLLRTAASGTVVNPYVTIWWNTATVAEIDYWFGGLVATGVAPQLGWTWSENATLVSSVQRWLHRYAYWGHLTESSVHPLYYDERCCHIEGTCEWIACEDIVLSRLTGGTIGEDRAVAGLYGGSSHAVTIAPALVPHNCTLLLFQAANVSHLRVDLGQPTDSLLTLAFMSDATVTLSGGWWLLSAGQRVTDTVCNSSGVALRSRVVAHASRRQQLLHNTSGLSGQTIVLRKDA